MWGCSVPWEFLPVTLHGCLAFIPKAKPLNGEVFLLEGHVDYKNFILVLIKQRWYSYVEAFGLF